MRVYVMWPNDPPAGLRPTSADSVEKHPLHTMTWRNDQNPRSDGVPSAFRFSRAATHNTRSPASSFSLAEDMPFKPQVLHTCGLLAALENILCGNLEESRIRRVILELRSEEHTS